MRRSVLLGPFSPEVVPEVNINRFGVIPKSNRPRKWRHIVDLSHPDGRNVNSGIDPEMCSLTYVRVDDVVETLLDLGPGVELANLNVKSAYRIVPVHTEDRHLLDMLWRGQVYIDAALPFGLRSAPNVFNALADKVEWMVKQYGVEFLWHYLDDFLTCGRPGTLECVRNLETMIGVCKSLGIPLAEEKLEGSSTMLVFRAF